MPSWRRGAGYPGRTPGFPSLRRSPWIGSVRLVLNKFGSREGERSVTFAVGVSGNPAGRPRGSKTKKQAIVEALFEGEIVEVAKKALDLARSGNTECIRMI